MSLYDYHSSRNRLPSGLEGAIFKASRRNFKSNSERSLEGRRFYESIFLNDLDYVKSRVQLGLYEVIFYYPLIDNEKPLQRNRSLTKKYTLPKFNCLQIELKILAYNGPELVWSELILKILNFNVKTLFLWILGFSAISGRARSIVFFGAFDLSMTNMSIREHFQPSVT